MKKIISALLVVILVFALASCKKPENGTVSNEKVEIPDKKVAIMVAPEEQNPEFYHAAKMLSAKYPDNVIIKEYADSRVLVAGNPEIMTLSADVAAQNDVGAIIYAGATQFTANAISSAKVNNSNIITVAIEPERNFTSVEEKADLVITADWGKYADEIVSAAKETGAEYFLCFSIEAQINSNPIYTMLKSELTKKCGENGIKFVYDSSYDTNNSGGMEAARLYVREAVSRHCSEELNGEITTDNVVLFSTDSSVQSTLADIADKNGYIYISPSFPTAYSGINEVYNVAEPNDIHDTGKFVTSLKEAIKANADSKGRFSIYNFPLASTILEGSLNIVFDMLIGKTADVNFNERVPMRLIQSAGRKKFTVEQYPQKYNVYMCYTEGFENI